MFFFENNNNNNKNSHWNAKNEIYICMYMI